MNLSIRVHEETPSGNAFRSAYPHEGPLPRTGERIVWDGALYTVSSVTHNWDMASIALVLRKVD